MKRGAAQGHSPSGDGGGFAPPRSRRWPPGVHPGEQRARLLAQVVRHAEGPAVILGEAVTATAQWVAAQGIAPHLWLDSAAEAQAVLEALGPPPPPPPTLCLDPEGAGLPLAAYPLVLLLLPRGRAVQRLLWRAAAALVHPRGRIAFVGAKREGIQAAVREGKAVVGRAAILRHKAGLQAGLASPPAEPPPFPRPALHFIPAVLEGQEVEIAACEGVFAAGRVDAGAAALISAMRVEAGERVLDLGCGTGVVGLAAALRGAQVVATDVSARAVCAARATFRRNGVRADVHHTVGGEGLPAAQFDCLLVNPPFHRGHERTTAVARYLIAEAGRLLRPGGRLYLVGNAFLPYGERIRAEVGSVRLVHDDGRFRVWEGIVPPAGARPAGGTPPADGQ